MNKTKSTKATNRKKKKTINHIIGEYTILPTLHLLLCYNSIDVKVQQRNMQASDYKETLVCLLIFICIGRRYEILVSCNFKPEKLESEVFVTVGGGGHKI